MKLSLPRFRRLRRGYTLLELSIGMMMGIIVSVMLLAVFNQQLAFLKIFNAQSFLTTEAPIINNYVGRVIGAAEGYRLYTNVLSLTSGGAPVLTESTALMLRFKEPNGTFRASVLTFENPGPGQGWGLYYRRVTTTGTITDPEWALSKKPTDVKFSVVDGILRVKITGPAGEEITYSGSQQL